MDNGLQWLASQRREVQLPVQLVVQLPHHSSADGRQRKSSGRAGMPCNWHGQKERKALNNWNCHKLKVLDDLQN